jgi:hypothetical protein
MAMALPDRKGECGAGIGCHDHVNLTDTGGDQMLHWLKVAARRGSVAKCVSRVETEVENLNDADRARVMVAAAEIGLLLRKQPGGARMAQALEQPQALSVHEAFALYREVEAMLAAYERLATADMRRKRKSYGDDVAAQYGREMQFGALAHRLLLARLARVFQPQCQEELHRIGGLLARAKSALAPAIHEQKKRHALAGNRRDGDHYDRLESSARHYAGNV